MPGPQGVHVDRILTEISIRYANPEYIGEAISPWMPVKKESDLYFVYDRSGFSIPQSRRADRTPTKEVSFNVSEERYATDAYGFHVKISDRERGNTDSPLDLDHDNAELLADMLLLSHELRVTDTVLDPATDGWGDYGASHFSNLQAGWDNLQGANPRKDIYYARYTIFKDARRAPNTMFIPTEAGYLLSQMDMVDELRKYTDPNLVTNSGIPLKLWGLNVKESSAMYNVNRDGETESFGEVFGNNVLICFQNPKKLGLKTFTFSVTFTNKQFTSRRWREDDIECDVIETTHMADTKIISGAAGFVYTNAFTPGVLEP